MSGTAADERDVIIGRNLRRFREHARLAQKDTASFIGVSAAQMQKYERGTNRISGVALFAIARRLQIPVTLFFEGVDDDGSGEHPAAEMTHSHQANLAARLARAASELDPDGRRRLAGIFDEIGTMFR